MGISKIGAIKTTLSLAVDYIVNKAKTNQGEFVYSFGCSENGVKAEKDFMDVRANEVGNGTVLAQHIKQSFPAGEVTPQQALKIGIKTAEEFLEGRYQFIVATHINTKNIHNHIIFNNVNYVDFHTFETEKNQGLVKDRAWKKLRDINDEVCKEYGLSVIENPRNPGKCYYEWQQDYFGKSWKSKLRKIIDETIMQADNFDDFLEKLRAKDVECVYKPQNVIKIKFRLKSAGQERFARGRTLGWYYDEPQLRRRIDQYKLLKTGFTGRTAKSKFIDTSKGAFQTSKGLLHWAEIKNMQEASRLLNFLTEHNIGSEKDMETAAAQKFNERMTLVQRLNQKQSRVNDIGDIIKLLRTYKKYKPVRDGVKTAKNRERYKRENAAALSKYDGVKSELLKLFPDRVLPSLESLERERNKLTAEIKKMNEQYKSTVAELKEIDFARQSLQEYLKTAQNTRSNERS